MFLEIFLAAAGSIINRFLQLDPETKKSVSRLSGSTIALKFTDLKQTMYLQVGTDGITLTHLQPLRIETTLSGSCRDFFAQARPSTVGVAHIEITGDTELAANCQSIMKHMDIDWEEELSRICGDVMAHQLMRKIEQMCHWSAQSSSAVRRDMADYLTEEIRLVPRQEEVSDQIDAIDQLRADCDRMEARINRLPHPAPPTGGSS